jgi:iron complex outermembrane receptor protein
MTQNNFVPIFMKLSYSLSLLCLLTGTAAAQTGQLENLVVEAARDAPSLTVPSVAASREELARTPGGTEVIDAERFLRGRASTMADTFALSPGVVAQPRFGSDEARLSIRGSGMQRTFHGRGIRVMQDGVPINLADGSFDMQAVDPLAAQYINVWRGSNALSLGSSTLGGAIDYISSTGLSTPGASLRLEGGSDEYLRARIAAGLSDGGFDGYFSLSEQFQGGYREHSEQNNQRLFSNLGWKLSDTAETRLFFTAVHSDSELPGSLTKAQLEDNPRQANAGNLALDHHRDFSLYRVASKSTVVNGESRVEFLAAFTYKDLDHPIFQVIDQLSQDSLLGVTFTRRGQVFARDNRLRAGAFLSHGVTDAAQYQNLGGQRGNLTSRLTQTATNLEAFIEDQLALGHGWTAIAGATASHNRRKNENVSGPTASYSRTFDDISPKFGVLWNDGPVQVFANLSSSYEPPSFAETNSGTATANKAQTANTLELGTRGQYQAIRWDATIYASEIQNEFLSLNDPNGQPLGTVNADRTIHQGVECFAEADLLGSDWQATPDHRLVLRGAWTYGRFEFQNDNVYGNNTIAGLPPHLIRGELVWENLHGYYAGPTVEWVPVESFVDQANTLSADPHCLLGFKIGRRVENGLSWFIEAKNLTNETYAATTGVIANAGGNDAAQFLPGDGRSVFVGLEWKW